MKNIYSVGQVNRYIKNMFTQDFLLKQIYVKGEVSNCKDHSSGHIYFSLKDETGSMPCVMFAGNRSGLSFTMKDGQNVIVLGAVSVYERDGRYQLYANEIILDGAGLLYEKFEALKRELEEMGMFAPEYKRPIPEYAFRIGVVTAPTGAAIRDIQNIAARRNPYAQLILYPALVQGKNAAKSIVKGIETLDEMGLDVLIVGRGGGSIEDLWAFNEEVVARAIFQCRTPVISAVGHETDFTIADYVADLRAPTPSAAAEQAVADIAGILERLQRYQQSIEKRMKDHLEQVYRELRYFQKRLFLVGPAEQVRKDRQRTIDLEERLKERMLQNLEKKKNQMLIYLERMKGNSPLDKLKQGYSYTSDNQGRAVTSISQIEQGEELRVFVTDGYIRARVEQTERVWYDDRKEESE